jgi:hypothetical protein
MSMLSVIQYFCRRTGLSAPTTALGSTDTQTLQILALLEEEGFDLSGRGDWQGLTCEATLITVATESQGAISTIASNGFRYIKNGTIWDRTLKLPIPVVDGQDWQSIKATMITGPRNQVRIRGGVLISNPVPTAGSTWAFEYISKNWILGIDGTTYKQYFTLDTDTILIPEEICLAGLRWRFKKEKGFEYAEDFRTYEALVKDALGRDGLAKVLNMSGGRNHSVPGIVVPDGSWSLP